MIAMRYGCVPVVRATGGLKDTVLEGETGFLFEEESADAMLGAIKKAISLYPDTQRWKKFQAQAMSQDFSWANSAMKYRDIYLQVMTQ